MNNAPGWLRRCPGVGSEVYYTLLLHWKREEAVKVLRPELSQDVALSQKVLGLTTISTEVTRNEDAFTADSFQLRGFLAFWL